MDEFIRRPKRPKIDPEESTPLSEPENQHIEVWPAPAETAPSAREAPAEETEVKTPKPKKKFALKVPTPKTKKQWIVAITVMILLLGGAAAAVYYFIIRDTSPAPIVRQEPEPEPELPPEPIYSRLSGRELASADINNRPLYAVQIENSPEARPQSGLREADMIFEAVAEGGITRFNAVYQDNVPANIGPVRSLRPYFIDWFLPFDAAIVHAGGSPEALQDVRNLGLKDIDSDRGIMRRVSNRYAPHNYYTTGQQVLDLLSARSYSSEFTGFMRKDAAPIDAPNAKNITLNISSRLYNVGFVYDPTTNTYLRAQGGQAHVDAENGAQIAPNVVVVPVLSKGIHPNRIHTTYGTTGSGAVFVFQDGTVTQGTWHKAARSAQWELKDGEGKTIELNRGQTWFTMIDSTSKVSFTP